MSHVDQLAGPSRQAPHLPVGSDQAVTPMHRVVGRSILLASLLAGAGLPLAPPTLMTVLLLPAGLTLLAARPAHAQITVSVRVGPPPLPFYAQPMLVGEGYLWLPGYWAWSAEDFDYFWVPGTWALAPQPGFLWTPGWWGFENSAYFWHGGYWAEQVGYYGGIDYGYGYSGYGYQGGRWDRGHFHYNSSVNNIRGDTTRYVYRSTSFSNHNSNRASFNGGPGGVIARPTAVEVQQQAGRHTGPTSNQQQHERQALTTPTQRQSRNNGAPPVAATPRPNEFTSPGAVKSRATRPQPDESKPTPAAVQAPREADRTKDRATDRIPDRSTNGKPAARPAAGSTDHATEQAPARPAGRGNTTNKANDKSADKPTQQPERQAPAQQQERQQAQPQHRQPAQQPERQPAQQQERQQPQQRQPAQQPERQPAQQQERAPAPQQRQQNNGRPEQKDEEPQRQNRGQQGEGR